MKLIVYAIFFILASRWIYAEPTQLGVQKPEPCARVGATAFGTAPGLSGFIVTYKVSDGVMKDLQSGSYNISETMSVLTKAYSSNGARIHYPKEKGGIITNSVDPKAPPIVVGSDGKFPDNIGTTPSAEAKYFDDVIYSNELQYFH